MNAKEILDALAEIKWRLTGDSNTESNPIAAAYVLGMLAARIGERGVTAGDAGKALEAAGQG